MTLPPFFRLRAKPAPQTISDAHMAVQKLYAVMDALGRHRSTSHSESAMASSQPAPSLKYRFRTSGSDAMVRAFSHTHAQNEDTVRAEAGVTIWPLLDSAALTGGFELPPTGQ